MKQYSFKTGLWKGVKTALKILAGAALLAGVSDLHLTDLITKYIYPLITGLSVGGVLTIALNYAKFKSE